MKIVCCFGSRDTCFPSPFSLTSYSKHNFITFSVLNPDWPSIFLEGRVLFPNVERQVQDQRKVCPPPTGGLP